MRFSIRTLLLVVVFLTVPFAIVERVTHRELVTVVEERFDRRLIASSDWADGKLICEVVEK